MAAPAPRDAKRARPAALEARVSTAELPGLFKICSVLAAKGGELFLGTETALYHKVNGRLALIAGHSSQKGFKDGKADEARFNDITGLALERNSSVLVCDASNHSVRRVSPHGQVTTVAGNGKQGFANGARNAARFNSPVGIDVDSQGLIYVADTGNHCIRMVQPADGTVSTLCGKGKEAGCINGLAAEARFNWPTGLVLDTNENLIIADCFNNCVRKVALPGGRVTTVAGSVEGGDAGKGYADGTGTAARFHLPNAVAVDGSNAILVADTDNHRVRKISGEGGVVTTVAGHAEAGKVDGTGPTARFNKPYQLTIEEGGQLIVAECGVADSVRVVEASLVSPSRQAAEETAVQKGFRALQTDYGKLLEDPARADVTFAVGGQRISAHRAILAARSEHFRARFEWEQQGEVAIGEEVSAGALRVLLRYLYTQELPGAEDGGEGLVAGEMAKAADYFQAEELYEHCVEQFKGGLRVGNVVERLVQAHDSGVEALVEAAMEFLQANVASFQVSDRCVMHVCTGVLRRGTRATNVARTRA